MIQLIGLIVAAYALARLCQVPFEGAAAQGKGPAIAAIALVSMAGIVAVGVLTMSLLSAGIEMPKP